MANRAYALLLKVAGIGATVGVGAALGGCGATSDGDAAPAELWTGGTTGAGAYGPGIGGSMIAGTGGASTGGVPVLPPEEEITFEAPVVTGKYLWSANPESSHVALVDAETYRVETLQVGNAPTVVAPVPGEAGAAMNSAIVLNVLSQDATLFHASAEGVDYESFLTHAGANAWAVSPSGRWAIAWTDSKLLDALDPTEGFQDVTLILLAPAAGEEAAPASTRHGNLGFRPSSISFDAAEQHAFIVTEDGVSVLDLSDPARPAIDRLVALSDNPVTDDPASRDVNVTPDGTTALVRRNGVAEIGVVDLETGELSAIPLPGAISDLDVSVDGARAVAVMRDLGKVAVLPLPAALTDVGSIETRDVPVLAGSASLAPDASVAVLYTTAVPSDVVVTLDLRPDHFLEQRVSSLKAPVRGVMVAPDAAHAVALLEPPAGSVKQGAFAILDTFRGLSAKVIGSDAPVESAAIEPGPESETALVTVRGEGVYGVYAVRLSTLQVDYVSLASPPLSAGLIPEVNKGFVAQQHPEGRLTFIEFPPATDVEQGSSPPLSIHTITGFELATKVVLPGDESL